MKAQPNKWSCSNFTAYGSFLECIPGRILMNEENKVRIINIVRQNIYYRLKLLGYPFLLSLSRSSSITLFYPVVQWLARYYTVWEVTNFNDLQISIIFYVNLKWLSVCSSSASVHKLFTTLQSQLLYGQSEQISMAQKDFYGYSTVRVLVVLLVYFNSARPTIGTKTTFITSTWIS